MEQKDLSGMLKNLSRSVCTSNIVVSPDPLSPTPSTSSTLKTPKNTEEDPNDPEQADERDIQMVFSSGLLYSQSIGAATKNYL